MSYSLQPQRVLWLACNERHSYWYARVVRTFTWMFGYDAASGSIIITPQACVLCTLANEPELTTARYRKVASLKAGLDMLSDFSNGSFSAVASSIETSLHKISSIRGLPGICIAVSKAYALRIKYTRRTLRYTVTRDQHCFCQ